MLLRRGQSWPAWNMGNLQTQVVILRVTMKIMEIWLQVNRRKSRVIKITQKKAREEVKRNGRGMASRKDKQTPGPQWTKHSRHKAEVSGVVERSLVSLWALGKRYFGCDIRVYAILNWQWEWGFLLEISHQMLVCLTDRLWSPNSLSGHQ